MDGWLDGKYVYTRRTHIAVQSTKTLSKYLTLRNTISRGHNQIPDLVNLSQFVYIQFPPAIILVWAFLFNHHNIGVNIEQSSLLYGGKKEQEEVIDVEQEDVGGTAPWLLKVILKCKTGSQSMHILPSLYYHPTNLVVRTYVDTHTNNAQSPVLL